MPILEKNFIRLSFTPFGRLPWSFNWYQSGLGYWLSLTSFVTRSDMEKGTIKVVVFNGEDFGYWKN
jgi:hypothetical protein